MMQSKIEQIIELYPDEQFMVADGFDEAIIGVDEYSYRVVYSVDQVITILMRDNMSIDEAYEFYAYSILGSYFGENTPLFVKLL